jgi:hypothetical protein
MMPITNSETGHAGAMNPSRSGREGRAAYCIKRKQKFVSRYLRSTDSSRDQTNGAGSNAMMVDAFNHRSFVIRL